mmetsp:Transcript_39483/g.95515  ORF Transcript_39483/g.95515 Transcript_39483/m.95515 type:complete len:557 (+) Transcript_39483:75-1745(+)
MVCTRKRKSFGQRLQELKKYKKTHGHCIVPSHLKENESLAHWANKMRGKYKNGNLTDSQVTQLNTLGFVWGLQELTWRTRVKELKEFVKVHGHTRVPPSFDNKPLNSWVRLLRKAFNLRQKGGTHSLLTTARIAELNKLGFDWTLGWKNRKLHAQSRTAAHGSTHQSRFPKRKRASYSAPSSSRKRSLAECDTFDTGMQSSSNSISSDDDEHDEILENEAGSEREHDSDDDGESESDVDGSTICKESECNSGRKRVNNKNVSLPTKSRISFEQRVQQLEEFKKQHGHCRVPQHFPDDPAFGFWAKRMRDLKKRRLQGRKTPLTNERVDALDNLCFEWDLHEAAWQTRIQGLKDFIKVHGHARVPCTFPNNKSLAYWGKRNRMEFRKHQRGEQSILTTERIAQLDKLGFNWNTTTRKRRVGKGRAQACNVVNGSAHNNRLQKRKRATSGNKGNVVPSNAENLQGLTKEELLEYVSKQTAEKLALEALLQESKEENKLLRDVNKELSEYNQNLRESHQTSMVEERGNIERETKRRKLVEDRLEKVKQLIPFELDDTCF